nr:MAG TPA: hypothetical protein [Caudoviricetes sp.]
MSNNQRCQANPPWNVLKIPAGVLPKYLEDLKVLHKQYREVKDGSKKQKVITVELSASISRDDEDKLVEIIMLEKQ